MKNGTRKRRAWSPTDVRELKTLAKRRTPVSRIARTFKRTEGAIRQKAMAIGLSLNTQPPRRRKAA